MYLTSGFDLTNAYDFLVENNHKSGTIFLKIRRMVLSKKFYLWEHHLMLQRF